MGRISVIGHVSSLLKKDDFKLRQINASCKLFVETIQHGLDCIWSWLHNYLAMDQYL